MKISKVNPYKPIERATGSDIRTLVNKAVIKANDEFVYVGCYLHSRLSHRQTKAEIKWFKMAYSSAKNLGDLYVKILEDFKTCHGYVGEI